MDTHGWHILQVASGFEVEAAKSCQAPCYVPRKSINYFNRRKRVMVRRTVPALPGFVFVQTNAPQTVKRPPRPEIFGFMRNGNRSFSILSPQSFRALMALEAELLGNPDSKLGVNDTTITVALGEEVELKDGPFAGKRARVTEIRGSKLLAELVEASIRIEFQPEQVCAA